MIRCTVAALLALLALPASAQTRSTASEPHEAAEIHVFQVIDGAVYLDGEHLRGAVPDGLDLTGLSTPPLEFSGPVTPVVEIDGAAWVLEDRRLVRMEESSRAGQSVMIVAEGEDAAAPENVQPMVEEAYMRDVASRNQGLYERMQREADLERDVMALAARVRAQPAGDEHDRLRGRLRDLLSDLLAFKHEVRAGEIEEAQDRLDAARSALAERHQHHDEIVDARLRELVGGE